MHEAYLAYIEHGKHLAATCGMEWNFKLDEYGYAEIGWNLTEISGSVLPPKCYLRDMGFENKTLEYLNQKTVEAGKPCNIKQPIDEDWQSLIKAVVCINLITKRIAPSSIVNGIIRPLKVIATCSYGPEIKPWNLTVEVIEKSASIALKIQKSGQLSDTVLGIIKNTFDTNHLAINCPLYPALISKKINSGSNDRRSKIVKSKNDLLESLSQRKNQEKLPEQRAFWELIRIAFTEKPKSFTDELRFAMVKIMVITGLRIGEVARLPVDWKRTRDYYDAKGQPAGELGGYSQALLLRHFAEKQQSENSDSIALFENTQYVPKIFEGILTET